MSITLQQFHEDFIAADEFNQILLLDNLYSSVDTDSDLFDESLVFDCYRNSHSNFIRRGMLAIIADLTLIGVIKNSYSTLALFYEILAAQTDSFLVVITLKYLGFWIIGKDPDLCSKILQLSESDDADIASEAMFCLGLIDIQNIGLDDSPVIFLKNLNESREKFIACSGFAENRTDAEFYIAVIDFLLSLTQMDKEKKAAAWGRIRSSLLTRCFYETRPENVQLEYFVFNFINRFNEKINTIDSVNSWLNFREDILKLFAVDTCIRQLLSSQNKEAKISDSLFNAISEKISEQFIVTNFTSERVKLNRLALEYNLSAEKKFITTLLDTVISNSTNEASENTKLLSLLISLYGHENGNLIYSKIDRNMSATDMFQVVQSLDIPIVKDIGYKTGTIVGHEVYLDLKNKIKSLLPDYPDEKLEIYLRIMEEVIRYARRTVSNSSKADFLFLYAAADGGSGQNASENDLQQSMYDMLKLTSLEYGFELEKTKFADGGRVDLVFKIDVMTIPIEFKKSLIAPTIDQIEEWYIAQTQTYTAAYDQLGLFVLLDLSTKNVSPNFKDWFHIHHLPPSTNMAVKYPDYVVSIVIPGNKLLPSSKSTYK